MKETAAPGFAALTDDQRAEIDDVSAMLTSNLQKITEHGKRADGIVKAMLEHSRGSSGERRMVDMNAVIDEALNLAYHGARAQDQSFNVTLERDFAEGIAPIEVNPQDMTRVFLNIFANGFYAANERARNGGDAGFMPTLKVTTPRRRRGGGNPCAGQRHRHSGRHQGQAVPAVLHHQANRRGHRSRSVDHLRHRHPATWRQHRCGQQGRRIQRVHDTAATHDRLRRWLHGNTHRIFSTRPAAVVRSWRRREAGSPGSETPPTGWPHVRRSRWPPGRRVCPGSRAW